MHYLTYIETNVTNKVNQRDARRRVDRAPLSTLHAVCRWVVWCVHTFKLVQGLVRVLSLPSHPWTCALLFERSLPPDLLLPARTSLSSSFCFSPWQTGTPWITPCATPKSGALSAWTMSHPTQVMSLSRNGLSFHQGGLYKKMSTTKITVIVMPDWTSKCSLETSLALSRPESSNCHERDGMCTENTSPHAHMSTPFSARTSSHFSSVVFFFWAFVQLSFFLFLSTYYLIDARDYCTDATAWNQIEPSCSFTRRWTAWPSDRSDPKHNWKEPVKLGCVSQDSLLKVFAGSLKIGIESQRQLFQGHDAWPKKKVRESKGALQGVVPKFIPAERIPWAPSFEEMTHPRSSMAVVRISVLALPKYG